MSKVIRLSGSEQRRWNSHASVVVSEKGEMLRILSPREVDVMFQLGKFVREKRQSARAAVPGESGTIEARLEKLPGSPALEARFFVDGARIEGMREVMSRELLLRNGECQIRSTNGKFLAVIRDPNFVRSTPADAQRTSPKPENCVCRDWGSPHPGKHHAICEHNNRAPAEERGEGRITDKDIELIQNKSEGELQAKPETAVPKPSVIEPRSPTVLPSPEECVCNTWVRPDGDDGAGHHPICEWRDPWENRESGHAEEFLSDLTTGERGRAATPEEILQADQAEKMTGSRIITIGEKSYAVVPEQ